MPKTITQDINDFLSKLNKGSDLVEVAIDKELQPHKSFKQLSKKKISQTKTDKQPIVNSKNLNPCLKYALSLVSRQDYNTFTIKQKILSKGYDEEDAAEAVKELESKGFINDLRFATAIINKYLGTKSEYWIVQKLRQKGFSKEIIQEAQNNVKKTNEEENIETSNYPALKKTLARRYKILSWKNIDQVKKNKVLGSLMRKGFMGAMGILKKWVEDE